MTVRPQDANTLTRHHRFADAAQDRRELALALVAERGILDREHRIGNILRLAKFKLEIGGSQDRRDPLHALQSFDAALRLLGLAGFGFEAVNEAL